MDRMKRVPVREQRPEVRRENFKEVCLDILKKKQFKRLVDV